MREPRRDDPAESFGPYLVFECLGRGGMATVHRAKQTGIEGFERPVALKRMLPWLTSDAEFIKSFVREARLAALLRHTNIVQTYDLGKVDSVYYIAMELVAGRDLRELLRHAHNVVGPPPPPVTIALLFQICDALDYAHNFKDEQGRPLGLVHRDISPANVIVSDDGNAKIVDFGVAKGSTATLATMSGMLKGKFAYMAPEMLQGQIDGRCDLFAVGVVAWELLTARPLFAGGDDMEILQRVTTWDPPAPSTVNPRVPRELDAWVAMALAKNPQRRFQSAAQMRAGLELVARTPAMRASGADVAAWMAWAFAQQPGVAPSPAPQIPAPLPAMPMPIVAAGTPTSTTAPPLPDGVAAPGMAPMMPGAQAPSIGGADSVSITIDDSTRPRVAPIAARQTAGHGPQVLSSTPGVASGARTMMLDESALIPVDPAPAPAEVGVTTLPGLKPATPHVPTHAAAHGHAPVRAPTPTPARAPAGNQGQHATMIGTAIPLAVQAAMAAAQQRSSHTAPPPSISPPTVPPTNAASAQAPMRTVLFDGAPPAAAHGHGSAPAHHPPAGMALPAMPPGASDPNAAPPGYAHGYGHPGPHAPPMHGGYPGAPVGGAASAHAGAPPVWGAGTPNGQPPPGGFPGQMPGHQGGPMGGFAPGQPYQAGPMGPGAGYQHGFAHGAGPGTNLPLPRAPGGNGLLIAIVLLLCGGAAVGAYFLLQHYA